MKKINLISYKKYKWTNIIYVYIFIIFVVWIGIFGIIKLNDVHFKYIYIGIITVIVLLILFFLKKRILTLSWMKSIYIIIEEYIFIVMSNLWQLRWSISSKENEKFQKRWVKAHTTRLKKN